MKKIVILEDEDILGKIYKKKLVAAGFDVIWTKTTTETEEVVKDFKPDLVYLDHSISGEDRSGIDIIPIIKRINPDIKIVMLSNYSHFELEKEAMRMGAEAYLVKIDHPPSELVKFAEKLLF